ncbi:hypothetical protein HK405_000765 [Cladochytrium tenue]|nr:hypothetical protein HK405_000765 [Cladochytrium tenue]
MATTPGGQPRVPTQRGGSDLPSSRSLILYSDASIYLHPVGDELVPSAERKSYWAPFTAKENSVWIRKLGDVCYTFSRLVDLDAGLLATYVTDKKTGQKKPRTVEDIALEMKLRPLDLIARQIDILSGAQGNSGKMRFEYPQGYKSYNFLDTTFSV